MAEAKGAADWSGNMLLHDLDNIDMLSEHYYASGTQHTDMKLEKKVPIDPPLTLIEWEREPATQVRAKYEHYQEYLKRIPALRAKPAELRQWFGHDPERWESFRSKYLAELKGSDAVGHLMGELRLHKVVTLLYAAHDEGRNNAVVLREYLEKIG